MVDRLSEQDARIVHQSREIIKASKELLRTSALILGAGGRYVPMDRRRVGGEHEGDLPEASSIGD